MKERPFLDGPLHQGQTFLISGSKNTLILQKWTSHAFWTNCILKSQRTCPSARLVRLVKLSSDTKIRSLSLLGAFSRKSL